MFKKLSKIIFYSIFYLDRFIFFLIKRSFLEWFPEFWQENSYCKKKILDLNVSFFIPNNLIRWRVDTLYSKEPDTLDWISHFDRDKNTIFWDIGANIGLYSIFNAINNPDSETYAFEPSTSNLRILSRNISINNLDQKIKIFTNPLTENDIQFLNMKEKNFQEGSAFNNFDRTYNSRLDKKYNNCYQILGMNIKYILSNNILKYPNYIKIDVDGNEDLIINGAGVLLKNKKIKSILCEIDENDEKKKNKIISLLESYNFKFIKKRTTGNISNFIFNK